MSAGVRGQPRPPASALVEVTLELPAPTQEDAIASVEVSIRATVAWVARLERELVDRARRGEEEAFNLLVGRIGNQLFGLAYHILRDAQSAEDAVQQALVDMWQKLPLLRNPDSFEAWSHRIVVRAAYAESGRHRRWIVMPAREPRVLEPVRDPASGVADRDQLGRGFRRLSIDHRVVVALKYFADRSDDQIADILEIPVGTVRSRLHASMRQLRAELEAGDR